MGTFERHRYPANWNELSRACKEQSGWICQQCGIRHGERRIGITHGNEYKVFLAACHVNHDPENPDAVLVALCQACHLKMDGVQHVRTKRRKRTDAQRDAGQLGIPWDENVG